ncbi:MAG TPA: hypothetical protein VIV40_29120, partial [Kofleriaceae bacterium]
MRGARDEAIRDRAAVLAAVLLAAMLAAVLLAAVLLAAPLADTAAPFAPAPPAAPPPPDDMLIISTTIGVVSIVAILPVAVAVAIGGWPSPRSARSANQPA